MIKAENFLAIFGIYRDKNVCKQGGLKLSPSLVNNENGGDENNDDNKPHFVCSDVYKLSLLSLAALSAAYRI
jgi:hypothetical protein